MPRNLGLYVNDLKKACEGILVYTEGMSREDYEQNRLVQRAVEREFTIIGEALAQMRRHHPHAMSHIEETGQIVGFRNVLAHNYADIDNDDVFSAVRSKLPDLLKQVDALMAKVEAGDIA